MHTDTSSSRIMRRLTTLFPYEILEERRRGTRRGHREVEQGVASVTTFPVSCSACAEAPATLAGFRRCYNATADEPISSGGFYHRLTPTLAEYLRDLVEAALDEVAVPDAVDADIDRFRDVSPWSTTC